MAGDDFSKPLSGDPFRFPAPLFGDMIDTIRGFKGSSLGRGGGQPPKDAISTGVVLVKNTTGSTAPQFGVLGIDSVVIDPATSSASESGFRQQPLLSCSAPDIAAHLGKFVVLLEPIKAGAIGRAAVDGVTIAKVDVVDTDHVWADVKDGDTASLASVEFGGAQILWKASSTGVQWAIVRIGRPLADGQLVAVDVEQTGGADGDDTTQATWTYTVTLKGGTSIGSGYSPENQRPTVGTVTAATKGSGYWNAGTFTLGWVNEQLVQEMSCEEA